MIVVRNLGKYYGGAMVLRDLTMQVERGEVAGILGPTGSGKTTLLRILATLVEPTRGTVRIDGRDLTRRGGTIRRRVGYIPDYMGYYEDMTVLEYLRFFAAAFDIPWRRRRAIIEGVLELTELEAERRTRVDDLARSAKLRLQLARVLTHEPAVILMDQPARSLDEATQIEVDELVRALGKLGKTILVTGNALGELSTCCTRFTVLDKGRLAFTGTLEDIRRRLQPRRAVRVRVEQEPERAASLLSALPHVREVTIEDEALEVTMAPAASSPDDIGRTLRDAGLTVAELTFHAVPGDEHLRRLVREPPA
jgi:ABC-2 type transport system ATP-binding protein